MPNLNFELVAPERLLVSRAVGMVVVPGEEGDFGVLAGHAPLIATLRTGVLDIYDNGAVTDRIFVAGGFAEVTAERCTILAEEAVPLKELDRTKLEADLKAREGELAVLDDAAAKARTAAAIKLLTAKLAALGAVSVH